MVAKLKLVRLTGKQVRLLGEFLVYFHGRRLHALRKRTYNPTWLEPIPLKQIYIQYGCNSKHKPVVKVAAGVFFKQVTRGCLTSGKCSTWEPREELHINSQVRSMIVELFEQNKEHIYSLRTYLNTPEKDK